MNVNIIKTKDYANRTALGVPKNKANLVYRIAYIVCRMSNLGFCLIPYALCASVYLCGYESIWKNKANSQELK
jgi:hypothetical protein